MALVRFFFVIVVISLFPGCSSDKSMNYHWRSSLQFREQGDPTSLLTAIDNSLDYLSRIPSNRVFHFYPCKVKAEGIRKTLTDLRARVKVLGITPEFYRTLEREYNFFKPGEKPVLMTGYYEPVIEGSLEPGGEYQFPLYRKPRSYRSGSSNISRNAIDKRGVLEHSDRAFVWLKNPVERAFLHIQGSGVIILPDGTQYRVGYEGSNGWPYKPIGRYMVEKEMLSLEEVSMQSIKHYLTAHPEVINEVLEYNQSYVFFRPTPNGPIGSLGVPVTPMRTLASDRRYFPAAAPSLLQGAMPLVHEGEHVGRQWVSRIVLHQDTGGAIKGGHVDFFTGNGPEAAMIAGQLKEPADVYLLFKKGTVTCPPNFFRKIKSS